MPLTISKNHIFFIIGDTTTIDSTEVVIFGLTNLMPLITVDLIRFPEFCSQYYKTIALFATIKCHKVSVKHKKKSKHSN